MKSKICIYSTGAGEGDLATWKPDDKAMATSLSQLSKYKVPTIKIS